MKTLGISVNGAAGPSFGRIALVSLGLMVAAATASAQAVPHFLPPATFVSNDMSNTGASTYWQAAGDFNGDGRIDFAAPDGRVANNIYGFSVVFGTSDGGFSERVEKPIGFYTQYVLAADFNRDGIADILAVTTSGVKLLMGTSSGEFQAPRPVPAIGANHAAIADFNGDGYLDVVAAGANGYGVALGNGDGTFGNSQSFFDTTGSFWVVAADFNNDGAVDFTGTGGLGGVTYLGNGNGTFQPAIMSGVAPTVGTLAADFNHDGAPELVMLTAQHRQDGSNFAVTIAIGWGDGTFSEYSRYVYAEPLRSLVVGDFNDDGHPDVATYVTQTGKLRVFAGDGRYTLGGALLDSPVMPTGALLAADVDGNGSMDLVQSDYHSFYVFRNTHGNPPLLAGLALTPAAVVGGESSSGILRLGGPAPDGGAIVSLSTSDASVIHLPTTQVTVPAGTSSVTFDIVSRAVGVPSSATITATWNDTAQAAQLDVVPGYTLSALSVNPSSQYGSFSVTGTVTLNQPADGRAVIALSSADPAHAAVPASVTVPAGATSVDFPIVLSPVTASTPVTITASGAGAALSSVVTVLKPADVLSVSKAILTRKTGELRIEAGSTSATTTISVYDAATGTLLGALGNDGGGRYRGSVFFPLPVSTGAYVLKSALGGTISRSPELK